MVELPAKPIQSSYESYSHHREPAARRQAPQPMTWNASQISSSYQGMGSDNRRTKYARNSYNQTSSSGSSFASTNGNMSTSQPSPSSSTTSTASSLRTPPDLLLNGSSLATSLGVPFSGQKGLILMNGKGKSVLKTEDAVHLSVDQLECRLQLLSGLSKFAISSDLPTPPRTPELPSKIVTASKKRDAAGYLSEKSDEGSHIRQSKKLRPSEQFSAVVGQAKTTTSGHEHGLGLQLNDSSSVTWCVPPKKVWSKELYYEVALAYRKRGRELKHRGDQRRKDVSTNKRLASSSPEKELLLASLEQTDALLLYMYGFWCEDMAFNGSCVVANWTSLYGLLKYVYLNHEKNKMTLLAGLCRLLEAVVLRYVANHELRQINHRLGKSVESFAATPSAQSPASMTLPSPSPSDGMHHTLTEISETMTRIVNDNERSSRLMQQAKSSILNFSYLREVYPRVADLCEQSMTNRPWNATDQASLASRVDPNPHPNYNSDPDPDPNSHSNLSLDPLSSQNNAGLATSLNGWVWPLDFSTPFPLIVCFGRATLREAAMEARLPFAMEPVRTA
ncbi:hypothetical protein CBS101457_001485 [Exobasidium rhododendri]|nr:hypothetical protein CBS101457_001485 [Exobasidium rhododendri]